MGHEGPKRLVGICELADHFHPFGCSLERVTEHRQRILLVPDVPEGERSLLVAHQPQQVVVEGTGDLGRAGQKLVLLLPDPADGVGDVDALPGGVGPIGAPGVEHLAVVEQHRATRHLGLGHVDARRVVIRHRRGAGTNASGAVLSREVGERPHRVALRVVVDTEVVKVERHLITMQLLVGLARLDRDDLGEMQLKGRGVAEELADGLESQGVHDQLSGRGAAGHERSGPTGEPTVVSIPTVRRAVDIGPGLGGQPVEDGAVDHRLDDGVAVVAEVGADNGRLRVRRESGDGHDDQDDTSPSSNQTVTDALRLALMEPPWQRRLAVRVTRDAERHIRAGHPWVFDRSIESAKPGEPGDLAVIFDRKRAFLAIGLYDPASPLAIRVLHTGRPATIDGRWLVESIGRSISRRQPLIERALNGETTAFRLVHGENDGLGGLVIDRYGPNLVIKLYTVAWLPWLDHLVEAAVSGSSATGLGEVERIVLRLSRGVAAEGRRQDGEILIGPGLNQPVTFAENGLTFEADLVHGQKTGHFLDQRDNRRLIQSMADGRTVLDVFACTGGFSVHAAAGGAASVMSVDVSRPALAAAQANMARNPAAAATPHRIRRGDAFTVMEELAESGATFDLVIVDPPAFAQRASQVAAALAAYERLATLAGRLAEADGLILQASCSSRIDEDQLVAAAEAGLGRSHRHWIEEQRTAQPLDHPVGFAQGRYLKAVLHRRGT